MCQFCTTGVKSSAFCTNILYLQFIKLWNATNFSTLYSVQNRFFSTMLRQYSLLSRHLSVPWLQQNPQHYTPSLRQALRSNPSPSLPDIFQYIHPESVICAGSPYPPLPEQYPQHKFVMLRKQCGNRQSHISSSSYSNRILLIHNVLPLSIRQIRNIFYNRNHCGNFIQVFTTSSWFPQCPISQSNPSKLFFMTCLPDQRSTKSCQINVWNVHFCSISTNYFI